MRPSYPYPLFPARLTHTNGLMAIGSIAPRQVVMHLSDGGTSIKSAEAAVASGPSSTELKTATQRPIVLTCHRFLLLQSPKKHYDPPRLICLIMITWPKGSIAQHPPQAS